MTPNTPQPDPTPAPPSGPGTDELFAALQQELRAMAQRAMASENVSHTLQATAVVNEAYIRMAPQQRASWRGRSHFLAVASQVIRRVLVDHARVKGAQKHGGAGRGAGRGQTGAPLNDPPARARREGNLGLDLDQLEERTNAGQSVDLLALDRGLTALGALSPRQAQIVEMRFFGGMSNAQVAEFLEVSVRTVESDWSMARAFLRRHMTGSTDGHDS